MGTLLTFEPPPPLLRAALVDLLGVDVGEARSRAAIRAEIAYYRAHLHLGRDAAAVDALRRACAEAMRPELGPAAGAPGDVLTAALLGALRFHAYPDAPGALAALRAAGLRLVVVSNWDASLQDRLAEAGLAGLVDGAVASAVVGTAKPDRAIFARGLALAGAEPAEAWHVGDSPDADVAGARAAGLRAALLVRERRGEEAERRGSCAAPAAPGAPVIASLAELPALIGA